MHERGCRTVGIDLGTTYSALAYVDGGLTPRVMQDGSGQAVVPSVVFFDEGEIIVGEIALQQAKLRADRVVQFIKVHMGDHWRREVDGRVHTPESVSAIILAYLVREAEPQIGPVTSAVITVPAYFTEKRRRATQQAGEIAGLEVVGTLNEPMAAALAYGLYQAHGEQTAVVYDLGGGTFDVTVVRIRPNSLEELATCGNRQLGGRDWDQRLIDYVAEDFRRAHGADPRESPQALQDLLLLCEQAKRRLSRLQKTSVRLHALGHEHTCEVTREAFESLTAGLLQATKLTTEMALEDAGLTWPEVSRVVLVGGSTHMPMVRAMLAQISGRPPDTGVNPVLAVALGAARYAQMLEAGRAPFPVRQRPADEAQGDRPSPEPLPLPRTSVPDIAFVTAHGVGIKAVKDGEPQNVVLIGRNTRVPCSVTRVFKTRAHPGGATHVTVDVTQGDTPDLRLTEVLGRGRIEGLPPGEPPGQPVRVTMAFDAQGRLHVHSVYARTGQVLRFTLEVPGGLAEEQVHEYRSLLEQSGLVEPSVALEATDPLSAFDQDDDLDDDVPTLGRWGN